MGLFDELDSNQSPQVIRTHLERLSTFAAGSIRPDEDDNEKVFFQGKYLDRPFRVKIDSSGCPELTIKVTNEDVDLWVMFEADAQPTPPADPDWDKPDRDVKLFFGPGVYVENSQERNNEILAKIGHTLVPGLLGNLCSSLNVRVFRMDHRGINVDFNDDILARDLVQTIQTTMDCSVQICRELKL